MISSPNLVLIVRILSWQCFDETSRKSLDDQRTSPQVLRVGGRIIISVWSMEQRHRRFESQVLNMVIFFCGGLFARVDLVDFFVDHVDRGDDLVGDVPCGNHLVGRVEICRERHDQQACKFFASCINFARKQRILVHNM